MQTAFNIARSTRLPEQRPDMTSSLLRLKKEDFERAFNESRRRILDQMRLAHEWMAGNDDGTTSTGRQIMRVQDISLTKKENSGADLLFATVAYG